LTTPRGKFAIAVVVAAVVVVAVLGSVAFFGSGSQQTATPPTTKTTSSKTPPATQTNAGQQWVHVPPTTSPLPDTVAQRTMDAALTSTWDSQVLNWFDSASVPAPGYAAGYSAVPITWSPDAWIRAWTTSLLTIDFAHQTRAGMGQWLSATRAQYNYPGLTSDQQSKALFSILLDTMPFDPTYDSGVPHASAWAALATAGTTWVATNVQAITVNGKWSDMVATSWSPSDQRMAEYDVTGTITSTTAGVSTMLGFSAAITVGSAWWQNGYGTSYFSAFAES